MSFSHPFVVNRWPRPGADAAICDVNAVPTGRDPIQTWFYDETDGEIAGSYSVEARKQPDWNEQ